MLGRYFVRPATINRIHSCWLGKAIDRYVAWLVERGYAAHSVLWRIPLLVRFGEFTHSKRPVNPSFDVEAEMRDLQVDVFWIQVTAIPAGRWASFHLSGRKSPRSEIF